MQPQEVRKAALELFKKGKGAVSVARQLGLSRNTVDKWHLLYKSGDNDWAIRARKKTRFDPGRVLQAVKEYLGTGASPRQISAKHGIGTSTIRRCSQNYINFGVIYLPRGKNTMSSFSEQKARLDKIKAIIDDPNATVGKKEIKEIRDILIVQIALFEEFEESEQDLLKKKEYRQRKELLKEKLACVKRALSSK